MATITEQDLKRTWKIWYASRVHFQRPCFSSCSELHKMAVLLFGRLFVLSFNHAYWVLPYWLPRAAKSSLRGVEEKWKIGLVQLHCFWIHWKWPWLQLKSWFWKPPSKKCWLLITQQNNWANAGKSIPFDHMAQQIIPHNGNLGIHVCQFKSSSFHDNESRLIAFHALSNTASGKSVMADHDHKIAERLTGQSPRTGEWKQWCFFLLIVDACKLHYTKKQRGLS